MYKWTKKDKDLVNKYIREALKILNMESWVIYSDFQDGEIEGEDRGDGMSFVSTASSSVTQEYEKITICWKAPLLELIDDKDYELARETVYHELIHGLTQEIYEIANARFTTQNTCIRAIERLTQRMTRIICTQTLRSQK